MRQGWNVGDAVTVVDCGPLGYGPAGHGHADALSFQIHASGYPFIVDPGAFSYNLDYAWRDAFRSTRAHNTVVVDGQDQSLPAGRMAWSLAANVTTRRWLTTESFDLVDAEHDGYQRLPDPVTHRRIVAYLKEGVWIVRDVLTSGGQHTAEWLFHLAPDCHVMADGDGGCTLQSPAGATLRALTVDSSGNVVPFTILTGTDSERAAWFSPGYGTRVPSHTLSVRTDFDRECVLTTYLWIGGVDGPAIAQRLISMLINE
jgi:uncharacterized heparinase superfamily protein